ncbi:MAG: outer membrane beta-barrel protein [Cyclobacteriaceae bacterium]
MKRLCGIVFLMSIGCLSVAQDAKEKPSQPDLEGEIMLDYGFSFWDKKYEELPAKVIGSNTVALYYVRRFEINKNFSFNPAVGVSFDKYAFSGNQTWTYDASSNSVSLDSLGSVNLTKNKLVASYFEVPLEIRYHPLGTVDGEGWFIGVGGVAGLRMSSHTKIKFDANSETYKEKTYANFDLNGFRYGLQFRFGFRNIHFFYKTYLNDVFKKGFDGTDRVPRASTIGINISGF